MATLDSTSLMFTLPLELREQIYRDVLSSSHQGPELLRTCREIYTEARKFLYRRRINFHDQLALFGWFDCIPLIHIPYVTEISLGISDVDHTPLLRPDLRSSKSTAKLLTTELYERELEKIQGALAKLPQVRSLTIRALPTRQSPFYCGFFSRVLEILNFLYPNLLEIRLEGNPHYQDLAFLSKFKQLRSFSFDGLSSSSPTEVASILSGLKNLTDLSLVSQNALLTPERYLHSGFTLKQQSFTPDVVHTMDQLASFSVSERIPSSSPTLSFTLEVLGALHNHKSLNSLSISLSHTPDDESLDCLQAYLENNAIQKLELDWSDLDPDVLEQFNLLPDSVRHLRVRSRCAADAFDILWSIGESRKAGDLTQLRSIVLVRSSHDDGNVRHTCDRDTSRCGIIGLENEKDDPTFDDTDEDNICRAKRRLQALGVRVLWCTENS